MLPLPLPLLLLLVLLASTVPFSTAWTLLEGHVVSSKCFPDRNPHNLFTQCFPAPYSNGVALANMNSVDADGELRIFKCRPGNHQPTRLQLTNMTLTEFEDGPGLAIDCIPCPPGSWSSEAGSANCTQCPLGQFSPVVGTRFNTTCSKCEAGTYADEMGLGICKKCAPGSASSTVGLTTPCGICPAGTSSGGAGSAACRLCAPGTYAPSSNSSVCMGCPPGTFSRTEGNTNINSCLPCPAGTAAESPGSSFCASCPSGSTSGPRASACISAPSPPVPSNCSLTPFAGYDVVGTRLADLDAPSEDVCAQACCGNSTCTGYSFCRLQGVSPSCILISNASHVVPSSFMTGAVRPGLLGL
jgi:hypothetical protein